MTDHLAQLTLGGGAEKLHDGKYLAPAQVEILRALDAGDNIITTLRAGRIVHELRRKPCERCADPTGKCAYVGVDGREALERLAARGIVRNISGALWCRA